jgi:hypothetical protein
MKKIESGGTHLTMPAVVVYRSTLDEIVRIIEGDRNGPARFVVDDYEFDSLDEVKAELGSTIRTMEIRGRESYKSPHLDFRIEDVRLYWNDKTLQGQGFELQALIKTHRRWLAVGGFARSLLPLALWTVPYVILALLGLKNKPIPPPYQLPAFAGILALTVLVLTKWPRGSVIRLLRQHEHATFWKRHEENLIRGLIGVIGAVVGGLIVYKLTH